MTLETIKSTKYYLINCVFYFLKVKKKGFNAVFVILSIFF